VAASATVYEILQKGFLAERMHFVSSFQTTYHIALKAARAFMGNTWQEKVTTYFVTTVKRNIENSGSSSFFSSPEKHESCH